MADVTAQLANLLPVSTCLCCLLMEQLLCSIFYIINKVAHIFILNMKTTYCSIKNENCIWDTFEDTFHLSYDESMSNKSKESKRTLNGI